MAKRKATKRIPVLVRLDPASADHLQAEADAQHRPLANLVAAILIDYCNAARPSKMKANGQHKVVQQDAA